LATGINKQSKPFHTSGLHFNTGYFDYILASQDEFDIFVLAAYTLTALQKL